ncbi:L-fuconolactonase [Marmoricola sp. OAE513]|uniref:amidohydrolase family protein n=1 Tax=Marmoricola sp. OAE513 TaxID=2817894 RepID=UPI001AE960AD
MTTLPDGLRIVDPHIHQWDPFTTPRVVSTPAKLVRRLPVLRPVIEALLPRGDREFVGDPVNVINEYLPTDYAADAGELPVGAVVHVEAAWKDHRVLGGAGETTWLGTLPFGADGLPRLGAIVCHADPRDPDVRPLLDRNLAAGPVRGIRCSAAHHPDRGVRSWADEGMLTSREFLAGFAAVAERGLSFEAWVYSHQLGEVVTLAREYPEATIVLDHYATPVGIFGPRGRWTGQTEADRRDLLARWSDEIAALAALPNVVAKHSGLGMPVLGWTGPVSATRYRDAVAPLVTRAQELFGADRTLWASNFPMDKPTISISTTVDTLLELLPSADPRKLLRDNACRVYRLDL